MVKYYVTVDSRGLCSGCYRDDIHEALPRDVIRVTQTEQSEYRKRDHFLDANKVWVDVTESMRDQWASEDFDKLNYINKRRISYPSIREQLDMLYADMKNSTTAWVDLIDSIKARYPKE
jgi:type II secretory pathway component PulJ